MGVLGLDPSHGLKVGTSERERRRAKASLVEHLGGMLDGPYVFCFGCS